MSVVHCGLWLSLVLGETLAIAAFSQPSAGQVVFRDASAEAGLDFHHFLGATGDFFMPEIMGSGVALLDYDGDGDLDVYLLQGAMLNKTKTSKDLLFPPPKEHFPGNRLFRNEIVPSGDLKFVDVTDKAGVAGRGFGMGAAAGDYNNDGHVDLFVSNYGRNTLFRNNGDGSFTDVTPEAGLGADSFSASAAFLDYDDDGDLDLFVTRYNAFSVEGNKPCYGHAGGRDYCGPREYFPLPDRLYRNDGQGHFTDVSEESGITAAFGNGLGVVCADFNLDGRIDIYVANDKMPNQLWINRGDGTFEDQALLAGAALNADGMAEAGMGVSAGDFDNDGDEDIFITHLTGETNTLYRNDGQGLFDDVTATQGLGHTSVPFTGFGTQWFDYNNDGRLDLFAANGEVRIIGALQGTPFPYAQTNQLFYNTGTGFQDVSEEAGPVFQLSEVSRGAAFGDLDNDGDVDIVVSNANGPVHLLLNEMGSKNHWLQVSLQGKTVNRDGYGSRIALLRAGRPPVWRRSGTDGSYLSASDPRIHFGLGSDDELQASPPQRILVLWPDGGKETWPVERPDSLLRIVQGTGHAAPETGP